MKALLPKMAGSIRIVVCLLAATTTSSYSSCGLTWYPPSNHFDGVNERGFVSYWEQIDSIDLGDDLKLPLIINFRSDNGASSPYLGAGWMLALLESRIYQIDDRNFVMIEPDGDNRYFSRQDAKSTVLKDNGGWMAEIKDDNTIVASAECGWKLTFQNGKLISIQTPENRKLDFIYDGGRVVEIKEGSKSCLRAIVDTASGLVTGLQYNDRNVTFDLKDRPVVQNLAGQNVVASMSPSLHGINGVPGGLHQYNFGTDDKLQPIFKVSDLNRVFTWNPVTNLIVSDTGWDYNIQPGTEAFANAAIQRTNAQGGTELWHYDRTTGEEIAQGIDGVKIVTSYFKGGLLDGKLRKVEQIANGTTKIVRALSYDEKGDLIREIGPDGVMSAFTYDDHGRLSQIQRDGKPFATRTYDDNDRVTSEEVFGADKKTYRYLDNGGYEKTILTASGLKSVETFDKLEKLVAATYSDGRGVNFDNFVRTMLPTTTEKRDALLKELQANLGQLKDPAARSDLLIRIGRIYTDDALGPINPEAAIKAYQAILADPTADNYSKAQAYSWVFSACLDAGKSDSKMAQSSLESLLALKPDGLSPERKDRFDAERAEAFGHLLAFTRTNQPATDEKNWGLILAKYGSPDSFKRKLGDLLTEQKRQMAIVYFNN